MHFPVEPSPQLNRNANMDAEKLDITAAFVDELLERHVLQTFSEGKVFMMNAPLFAIPKEG
jgi:hypothetical protein